MKTLSIDELNRTLPDCYTVEELVDRGGLAIDCRAFDRENDRPVTLSVLRPELSYREVQAIFSRTTEIMSQLDHHGIVRLLDSGNEGSVYYRVTEYLGGETLGDRLMREGQQPLEYAMRIVGDTADAIAHAHERGVVVGKMTPASITLTRDRTVLTDLSHAFGFEGGDPRDPDGMAVGNPTYLSPEWLGCELEMDSRTDIYSLGILLYEMLAGEPPFLGRTSMDIVSKILHQPLPPLLEYRPALPRSVPKIVEKALSKSAADRYQTAREFRAALENRNPPHPPGAWWWRVLWYVRRSFS